VLLCPEISQEIESKMKDDHDSQKEILQESQSVLAVQVMNIQFSCLSMDRKL